MTKVTKESLAKVIRQLEEWESDGVLTLKEEFQLGAYRALLRAMSSEPVVFMGVFQNGKGIAYYHTEKAANKDGADEIVPLYEDFTNE